MKLVTTVSQVLNNISTLSLELDNTPELVDRVGLVHTWYIDARDREDPKYGFSKFVGYQGLDAETYLRNYKKLNGRNTEWALRDMCEELRPGSPEYLRYHEALVDWLAGFSKKPRNPVRLMLLKPEIRNQPQSEDRRLLELISAAADLLPLDQRHELRSRL